MQSGFCNHPSLVCCLHRFFPTSWLLKKWIYIEFTDCLSAPEASWMGELSLLFYCWQHVSKTGKRTLWIFFFSITQIFLKLHKGRDKKLQNIKDKGSGEQERTIVLIRGSVLAHQKILIVVFSSIILILI